MAKIYDLDGTENIDDLQIVRLGGGLSIEIGAEFILFSNEVDDNYHDLAINTQDVEKTLEKFRKGIDILLNNINHQKKINSVVE